MGKSKPQLPLHRRQQQNHQGPSFLTRCSIGFSRTARCFSFKCVCISLLSVSVFFLAIFSVFRRTQSGFDGKDSIKNSAKVQAYFSLQKPIWFLLPQIKRLEYDINAEIGLPNTQVAILSMHKTYASNTTHIIFGVLSDPLNSPINEVSLSLLRSSLVDLFAQRSNLTLSTSIFGHPSSFQILKFPGGITIISKSSPTMWTVPIVLFNFTLPNSLHEIEENSFQLRDQLQSGLHLLPHESVFLQLTNKAGSTKDPPVTVQASIVSERGSIVPDRLKQLAQTINGSHARNLGLDNTIFGKVKEVSLSSYLSHTLDAPSPSPAPSPDQNHHLAPSPAISSFPDSPDLPPCSNSEEEPDQSLPSPAPSMDPSCGGSSMSPRLSPMSGPGPDSHAFSPCASASLTPMYPRSEMSPDFSPLPAESYGSRLSQDNGYQKGLLFPALPSSSSSSTTGSFNNLTNLFGCCFIFISLL